MSVTYSAVPIAAITDLEDFLVNHGAQYVEPWELEVRLYRANQASFGPEGRSLSLFTIWASHNREEIWCFSPKDTGLLATRPLRQILESKLQSLWTLRQTFKGQGHSYKLDDGSIIRLSNVLVQGNYKGLLVDADGTASCQGLLEQAVEVFGLDPPQKEIAKTPRDRARMYRSVYR